MAERREGITIGQPPKYIGYEDKLYKVINVLDDMDASGKLHYECECKLCGGIHIRTAQHLKRQNRARECPKYVSSNWTGLDRWDAIIRRTYGITLEEYNQKLEAQGNVCEICGKPDEVEGRRMAIDHCHDTGQVRGLLCGNCNRGLGNFKDSPDMLQKALDYLVKYSNAR
jgi:hypothetical protein